MTDHAPPLVIEKVIPLRFYSSPLFTAFWVLTLSKFLLFLTHNMIQNLAVSILGRTGANAIVILYIAFILGNFLAPKLLDLADNNSGKLMYWTSILYTIFAIATTFVVMLLNTEQQQEPFLSKELVRDLFFVASAIVGLAGGCIWVGYGVLNIELGDSISQRRFQQWLEEERGNNTRYSDDELLTALNQTITGKIMSVGWSVLSLNTVIGGLLTFIVLSTGEEGAGDATSNSALSTLFIVFSLISCLANVSYYILAKLTDSKKNNQITTPSDTVNNLSVSDGDVTTTATTTTTTTITTSSSTATTTQYGTDLNDLGSLPQGDCHVVSTTQTVDNNNTTPTSLEDSYYPYASPSNDNNPTTTTNDDIETQALTTMTSTQSKTVFNSQWLLFLELMQTRYVMLSMAQYITTGMTFNFLFSSFSSFIVTPILGTKVVAIVVILAYSISTATSFFIAPFLNTRLNCRLGSIFGTIVQLIPPLLGVLIRLDGPRGRQRMQHRSHKHGYSLSYSPSLRAEVMQL